MAEVRIVGAEHLDGLELRTQGLVEQGLPELCARGLPPYLGQGWARVLAALAQSLVAGGAEIPDHVILGTGVRVRLIREGDLLLPVPPDGEPTGEWRRELVLALFC
ncbi:hypothetical protein [Spirillospora sp. CA-294931]|uniref:hypothetical protein n=1 Tax=Spirillospora sp. CA-294931 TaxID=3240042 RepID=UPI003D8D258C